jgi:major vault protein
MYLPDPRTQVVVKRKLTARECELIYPGNREVLAYNSEISEKAMEKLARKGGTNAINDAINNAYSTSNQESALAIFEATSNISRGVSYTKPRTITLDTKYDGVVNVNVWTGYAVNVVSRTGEREIIVGPAARMLDYDETLEPVSLSTGKPKTADNLLTTAYLRVENNKVSDIIEAQTKDYVSVRIKVSYCVDFLPEFKDKWFSVDNYVKYLCDRQRSLLKREIKKYTIEEFYENATDIVRSITLDKPVCTCEGECETCNCDSEVKTYDGRLFKENGMLVHDTEVLSVMMDGDVARMMEAHQKEMITKCLELSDAERKMEVKTKLAEYERKQIDLVNANKLHKLELEKKAELAELAKEAKIVAEENAMQQATKQAEADLQKVLDAIQAAELARNKRADKAAIETEKQLAEIEKARQEAYAATVKTIMESVDESLVAALTANANADMLAAVTKSVAPYAMAKGETVADFTNTLLRGTTLEGVVDSLTKMKVED